MQRSSITRTAAGIFVATSALLVGVSATGAQGRGDDPEPEVILDDAYTLPSPTAAPQPSPSEEPTDEPTDIPIVQETPPSGEVLGGGQGQGLVASSLAQTGTDGTAIYLRAGLGLIAGGGLLVVLARRRRHSVESTIAP